MRYLPCVTSQSTVGVLASIKIYCKEEKVVMVVSYPHNPASTSRDASAGINASSGYKLSAVNHKKAINVSSFPRSGRIKP